MATLAIGGYVAVYREKRDLQVALLIQFFYMHDQLINIHRKFRISYKYSWLIITYYM